MLPVHGRTDAESREAGPTSARATRYPRNESSLDSISACGGKSLRRKVARQLAASTLAAIAAPRCGMLPHARPDFRPKPHQGELPGHANRNIRVKHDAKRDGSWRKPATLPQRGAAIA